MSDGLRDALEKLADQWDKLPCVSGYEIPNGDDSQCLSCAAVDLRDLLAAHPEDELDPADFVEVLRPTEDEPARFGDPLAARQPSDAAVEAAFRAYMSLFNSLPTWGTEEEYTSFRAALVAAYRVDVPQPLLDREAVRRVFVDALNAYVLGGVPTYYGHIDAVMELARPMPTREQIEDVIDWGRVSNRATRRQIAESVLALLNGADAPSSADDAR